jgi:hypothetical protein
LRNTQQTPGLATVNGLVEAVGPDDLERRREEGYQRLRHPPCLFIAYKMPANCLREFSLAHLNLMPPHFCAGASPFAGGEHEFTVFGFRDLLEANALDYNQFDTNRVGGVSRARKTAALAEAYQIPVIPHAGQVYNYHVVMVRLNSPMAEFFPRVDVEVGNELFWYLFDGEPEPVDSYIDLVENMPGLGLTVNEESLRRFKIIEWRMKTP